MALQTDYDYRDMWRTVAFDWKSQLCEPAGLPNQDEIDAPFEYLETLNKSVTVLVGDSDDSSGRENIARLVQIGTGNPVLDVHVYAGSGHGFLEDLDSTDEALRTNAEKSLATCMQAVAI